MTIAVAQIEATGQMPATDGLEPPVVLDMTMSYVLFLIKDQRTTAAMQAIEYLVYADDNDRLPLLYASWLWLARMTLMIADGQHTLALSSAEKTSRHNWREFSTTWPSYTTPQATAAGRLRN